MRLSSKRRKRFVFFFILLVLLSAGAIIWFYKKDQFQRYRAPIRYDEFGISLPAGYLVHGIDVSRYQGSIDWQSVSQMKIRGIRMDFAFMKATEGTSYVDPNYEQNWSEISQTHMIRGAYHYFDATSDGEAQAKHFIRVVELRPGDLAPVLDVEELKGVAPQQMVEGVRRWINLVERHYRVKPIIYSGADFYKRYLATHFSDYPLWVAHYYQPCEPRVGSGWKFWQHNDRGRVNGIEGGVDFNVFNGSRVSLDSLRIPRTIP